MTSIGQPYTCGIWTVRDGGEEEFVTRWTARGTHTGDLWGIPGTGKEVTVTGTSIDRIKDGWIVESWSNWDALGLMQQLGAIPTPGQAG